MSGAPSEGTQLIVGRIGDELRGARFSIGKSIDDVQHELKLRAAHVDAIERGDLSALPGTAYVVGYVKSYARYLGLDPEIIWARFVAEHKLAARAVAGNAQAGHDAPKWQGGGFSSPSSERAGFSVLPVVGLLIGLGLLAVIGYGASVILENVQRMPSARPETVEVAAPVAVPQPPRPAANAYDGNSGVTQAFAAPPKVITDDGPISAIDPKQAASTELAATDINNGTQLPAATDLAVPAVSKLSFGLISTADVWLRATAPGDRKVYGGTLPMGQPLIMPTDQPIVLHIGNAGVVLVVVDGVAFGPLGGEGRVVKDLTLTPANAKARFKPVAGMAVIGTPATPPKPPAVAPTQN